MLEAIRHNFAHLLDFRGREARPTFWYFVLFVFLLNLVGSGAVALPGIVQAISDGIETAQVGGNRPAMDARLAEDTANLVIMSMWASLIMGAFNIALLAAAFVRRLHDAGFSGWWALLPGALSAVGLVRGLTRLDAVGEAVRRAIVEGASGPQMEVLGTGSGLNAVLGWGPTLLLIGFGVLKSTAGSNRYGEEPSRT